MAKDKKVSVRDTPKYTTSSDDDSSDDEVDYSSLFKGLDRAKVEKINELIDALNEKDRLLEKQEDILYEEHDKFISVQKSLALEIKRNEVLSSELSACHESASSLRSFNDELNAKLEEVNKSCSCVEHVVICNRCKDFDVNACDEPLISVAKLNDEVASLNAQLKTCRIDFGKLKFARDAYTVGRHPSIRDGLGFRKEAKNLTSQRTPVLNKEKGKAPMASSSQRNHAFIYDRKIASRAHYNRNYDHDAFNSHAMFASSSTFVHGRSRPRRNHVMHHVPRKMCNESTTVFHACNTSFVLSC
jgi:vacuolar-type H+-ATPase subunit H